MDINLLTVIISVIGGFLSAIIGGIIAAYSKVWAIHAHEEWKWERSLRLVKLELDGASDETFALILRIKKNGFPYQLSLNEAKEAVALRERNLVSNTGAEGLGASVALNPAVLEVLAGGYKRTKNK